MALSTATLPVLPLTTSVVLPSMVVTLALETDDARAAADAATSGDGRLLLVPRLEGRYAKVGVVARIETVGNLPNGTPAVLVRALQRATVGAGVVGSGSALWVEVSPVDDAEPTARAKELARELRALVEGIAEHRGGRRLLEVVAGITDPAALADTAGYWPELSVEQRVELLETLDVEARLALVLGWARDALGQLELTERIRSEVSEGMEKQQREYLLRQQMAAIRKELAKDEGGEDLVDEYRRKVAALATPTDDRTAMPDDVRAAVEREVDRLERTSEQGPEHGWIRTWLDTVLDLPWGVKADEHLDLVEARRVLDADHFGLGDVKDRIVELLAVRKLRTERGLGVVGGRGSGAILALVGPPGVGKTSLGESVARALGRPFVRVALGGVRDEAEIRGHRRTYVGAMPGRIVRALKEAKAMNPVLLLDEVDKLGADYRGDPSAALLEVLDPAQNHTFRDHYLEVDLDLSDVVFVATANVADTIPGPLLDRMEVVRLDGYTEDEKVAIARDHLWPRQLEHNGLTASEVTLTDAALRRIITDYTREAGVRGLERALAKVLRKAATRIASATSVAERSAASVAERSDSAEEAPVVVDTADLRAALGRAHNPFEEVLASTGPGVATGLAVTGMGGDVLSIEATSMPGEPSLTLTGQLGDVMKESAEIALSWLRSHADEVGVDPAALERRRFHLHVPAGAVPKDGPSAGITMVTALASLATGRPVQAGVGMTGEVTLQGRVLPIGGVRQKVLAAHRAGLHTVILPKRNGEDLDEVPESVRADLTVHLVDDVRQVLQVALTEPAPEVAEPRAA